MRLKQLGLTVLIAMVITLGNICHVSAGDNDCHGLWIKWDKLPTDIFTSILTVKKGTVTYGNNNVRQYRFEEKNGEGIEGFLTFQKKSDPSSTSMIHFFKGYCGLLNQSPNTKCDNKPGILSKGAILSDINHAAWPNKKATIDVLEITWPQKSTPSGPKGECPECGW